MRDLARIREERVQRRAFERLVVRVLDNLPDHIHAMLDNVEVVVEEEPTPRQLRTARVGRGHTLFGLYEGVPLTQRDSGYSMVLPDKVTIFRGPIERACPTADERARQVRITVIHELAHHVGIDEDRLAELGWS
jgi:predicted Zn-dependent protease with MMP-like domain